MQRGEDVKRLSDPVRLRQSLLELLESEPVDEEKLLASLHRQSSGLPLYSSALSILTHLDFAEAEAQRHWQRIRSHRARMAEVLDRDVGLRVALLDYFVNLNKELKNPKIIEIAIYRRTERDAVTDGLTGLFNHAYFTGALKREVQRAKRHDLKLSLLLFDLDDFKRVNDVTGHVEGDRVLVKTAALIKESLREIDIAARYGGEEYAIVLPETARVGAHLVAERIRTRIAEHFRRRKVPVTASGGVATFPEDAATAEELLRRADEGVYRSKADGKNRITGFGRERRRHKRLAWNEAVTVKPPAGRGAPGRARNMSAGGLLVSLRKPVPVGSAVTLIVRPQGTEPLGLRGEVVRVSPLAQGRSASFDVGIRFLSDPGQTQELVFRRVAAAVSGH